jgi:hypothetical protein
LTAALLLALLVGCRDRGEGGFAASQSGAILVASGDTAGWIMPCGCTANQSGGLLRRATYLDQLRKAGNEVVYVDVGGAAAGTSDYQKVKFEAILAGEKLMGIAGHNLGRSELAFGPAYLRDVMKRSGVLLLSANALDATTGEAIGLTHRIVEMNGKRVAIVGVVSPKYASEGIRITDPRQAILATVATLKEPYQSLVVLAYLPDDELPQLAAALPEADVVLGGPTGQAMTPRKVGPTLLAAATNKGKFLLELHNRASGWDGKVAEMGPELADDPQQKANLDAYLAELGKRNFTASQSGFAPMLPPNTPASYAVAGSASCVSCHKDDSSIWEQTKHAHAWEVLEARKMQVDPYCMQCHTTGFGLPGGFESLASTPKLLGVGCESCHGPSLGHVQKPTVHTSFAANDQCVRCHDHENSPTFVYGAYWPRVAHGKKVTARVLSPLPPGED